MLLMEEQCLSFIDLCMEDFQPLDGSPGSSQMINGLP